MKLEYLFTKARKNKIGSRLISWGTGKLHPNLKPCSHVAIKAKNVVFESTIGTGVRIIPYKLWIQENEVVHAFECPKDRKVSKIIETSISCIWGKKYDWLGILYFVWRMLGFLILKRPLPAKNRWERPTHFFCVELLESITGEKYSMTSPIQLVSKWDNKNMKRININKYNNIVPK